GSTPEEDLCVSEIFVSSEDIKTANSANAPVSCDGRADKVKKLSLEQLAALCVGYGPGTPFAAFRDESDPETIYDKDEKPVTTNSHPAGYNGYVSPAIEEAGIYSVSYKDGPAGIGEMAWPSEMLMACAFNKSIWYKFGDAVGAECERRQVDVWLAPAVNLHRHPLGGRNFEYFSEDPYLTGICACEITKGVQENHSVLVCPKHFAVNEQETFRRGSSAKHYDAVDSILNERAAREIYLKPFEMLVREADIACLMTSFNKINGVFAAGNTDLCTHILKKEWGYQGVVVTDWGDMDVVVDGADAVAAGNDIVMPGGPPVIGQILQGYHEGRVSRKNLEDAVMRLLYMTDKI
ncbi:MAG: beta-glucosidase, partial [Lachnospiraceae bacterium]|nr:beta-glucosidase [Lachnospiraceae bacterium]